MLDLDLEMKRSNVEVKEKWRDWSRKIPALHFKEEWNVHIIPPFGGALARFRIEYNNRFVSVYFDAYSRLGWMMDGDNPIPYWELYAPDSPSDEFNDVKRYYLNDTDELMHDIEIALS